MHPFPCWYIANGFQCVHKHCNFSHDEKDIEIAKNNMTFYCPNGVNCPKKCKGKHNNNNKRKRSNEDIELLYSVIETLNSDIVKLRAVHLETKIQNEILTKDVCEKHKIIQDLRDKNDKLHNCCENAIINYKHWKQNDIIINREVKKFKINYLNNKNEGLFDITDKFFESINSQIKYRHYRNFEETMPNIYNIYNI